jgi:hypothetical protein
MQSRGHPVCSPPTMARSVPVSGDRVESENADPSICPRRAGRSGFRGVGRWRRGLAADSRPPWIMGRSPCSADVVGFPPSQGANAPRLFLGVSGGPLFSPLPWRERGGGEGHPDAREMPPLPVSTPPHPYPLSRKGRGGPKPDGHACQIVSPQGERGEKRRGTDLASRAGRPFAHVQPGVQARVSLTAVFFSASFATRASTARKRTVVPTRSAASMLP